jgi:hypothetical protein
MRQVWRLALSGWFLILPSEILGAVIPTGANVGQLRPQIKPVVGDDAVMPLSLARYTQMWNENYQNYHQESSRLPSSQVLAEHVPSRQEDYEQNPSKGTFVAMSSQVDEEEQQEERQEYDEENHYDDYFDDMTIEALGDQMSQSTGIHTTSTMGVTVALAVCLVLV